MALTEFLLRMIAFDTTTGIDMFGFKSLLCWLLIFKMKQYFKNYCCTLRCTLTVQLARWLGNRVTKYVVSIPVRSNTLFDSQIVVSGQGVICM